MSLKLEKVQLRMSGMTLFGHFVVYVDNGNTTLACGFFDRSKAKVRYAAANFGSRGNAGGFYFNYKHFQTESESNWNCSFLPMQLGRSAFTYCLCTNNEIGANYILTSPEDEMKDLYNFLMTNYKLPLLEWWIPVIRNELRSRRLLLNSYVEVRCALDDKSFSIPINGKMVDANDLIVYDSSGLTQEALESVVSSLLANKIIWISQKQMAPLQFSNFDEYITNYGPSLVDNLNEKINPLCQLKPNVDTLALKEKSLFPQQAASVNGVNALRAHGIKYGVLNHGMGVGKTLQACSVVESSMIDKYLRANPGKTLRDAYEPGVINYRAIIMAPGHLLEKWKAEIETEIPYAKATIITEFSQLLEMRDNRHKPNGKEFFIIGKDYAKLDTQISPIPTAVKMKHFSVSVCSDCKEDGKIFYKKGTGSGAFCPACKGTSFEPYSVRFMRPVLGLTCPCCNELLMRNRSYNLSSDYDSDSWQNLPEHVLTPKDFSARTSGNEVCYHCGAALWGSNARPICTNGAELKKPKWYRISHFVNHTRKGRKSAFVLRNHEEDYTRGLIVRDGIEVSERIYGPRKYAPAHFIKRYLKNFFDFCILDEMHKYLGDGSAQSVAAHALTKVSKFTIPLTGTLSNGTAASFFNLFWMLEPRKMIADGYTIDDMLSFCKKYGCVESAYEAGPVTTNGVMSRGRIVSSPHVVPGISPVLFGKYLMDRCLFLDISDLSKYLPPFSEKVVCVDAPIDVMSSYRACIDHLKSESRQGRGGMAVQSTMLQFGLSYLDKPYGRNPIMHPFVEGSVIVNPASYDEYADVDTLMPKEEKLISIIRSELEEGRNCFVYATFTGAAESNVVYRLKDIIETHCNLRGRVCVIESSSPEAKKREDWFHQKASEGIRVFISNPENVETGLDFCFKYKGALYNYPTLIFMQTSYKLATIWQASRRAYRLNQKEECRNYYLAYTDTLQTAALEIMARKQVAAAALQGKFSTEGLSAMAQGVDARTQLAAALAEGDMSSRESLETMFDALASTEDIEDNYSGFVPSPTFYELMNIKKDMESVSFIEAKDVATSLDALFDELLNVDAPSPVENEGVSSLFDSFFDSLLGDVGVIPAIQEPVKKTKKKKAAMEGEISLFDAWAV